MTDTRSSTWGGALLCALAALLGAAAPVAARPQYAIGRTLAVPGDGSWDYLTFEQGGKRLFIAHGDRVEVIDTERLVKVGEIPSTPGVHGIALAPLLRRGFISAGAASTIVVFDLDTLARLAEVHSTGENPDAITYEPVSRRVFAFNGRSDSATVLDATSNAVVATVPLGGKPEFAVADGHGRVYVNLEDRSSIAVIDAPTLSLSATWPLAGCERPTGLALDATAGRLYSVCLNRVMAVTDAKGGASLGTVPIGGGADAAAYDPTARLAFAACGAGELTVVAHDARGAAQVVQSLTTQPGARTLALDERSHRIYLVTASFGPAPPPGSGRPPILPGSFRLLVLESHREKFTTSSEERQP